MKKKLSDLKPAKILPLGFLAVILAGTVLLMLPISSQGKPLSFFDAFFEATSATCVTGLIVVDTATTFTFFGQLVLLLMIQLGGLGFMTVATSVFVAMGKKISLKERMTMAESVGEDRLQGIIRLVFHILRVTFTVEGVGALLLMVRFIPAFGYAKGIWMSIFTSISAFCNAGFDLMGNYTSLTAFDGDLLINFTVCALIIIGGLGFATIADMLGPHKERKIRTQTRMVLIITACLIFIPAVFFFFNEADASMAGMPAGQRMLASLFQSVTCRTAGFNTVDQMMLKDSSKLLSVLLMFIGGAPGGTAGGIKLTTVAVIFFSARSLLSGKDRAEAFGHWISKTTVIKACAIGFIALGSLFFGVLMACVFEGGKLAFIDMLFELTSAIATVGLGVGLSGSATLATRCIICMLMYLGRCGILTMAIALGGRKEKAYIQYPEADIMVG